MLTHCSGEQQRRRQRHLNRKSHTQPPRQTVCLKPALRVYALLCLPSGMSGQCPWAPRLFGMGEMVNLISSPVTVSRQHEKKKAVCSRTWPSFSPPLTSLSDFSPLGKILTPAHVRLFCGINTIGRPAVFTKLENNNLACEPSHINTRNY